MKDAVDVNRVKSPAGIHHSLSGYKKVSEQELADMAKPFAWIADPIQRACSYVLGMPYFDVMQTMTSPHDFRSSAVQFFYHSAKFPKVLGLMLPS